MLAGLLAAALPGGDVPAQQDPGPVAACSGAFRARLSPLPVTRISAPQITGRGEVIADLRGAALSICGEFAGLQTGATTGELRSAPPGLRGAVLFSFALAPGVSGRIRAELTLSPAQIEALRAGSLYVQINSEKLPEGNLRGWLLQ